MKITRRTLLGTIAAGFAAGPHFSAFAEGDWPSRVVRLVSPYGAGGASDISLRILAEQFGRSLNQPRTSRARARASPTSLSRAQRRTDTPSSMRPRHLRRPKPCSRD
jgi:hypothetical protein